MPLPETWFNRRSMAWAGYDVASSVYAGVVPAVLAPLYFRELMVGFENPTAGWGLLSVVAVLVSSVAALTAAWVARWISRFSLLAFLTAGLLVAMAALAWNPQASLVQAALAFIAAQSFYFAAMAIYESFLPDLVATEGRQKLSGFGWAVGYMGGLIGIIVLLSLVAGKPQGREVIALCFGTLAVVSGVIFAVVLMIMRREGFTNLRGGRGQSPELQGVIGALQHWRFSKGVFQLLLGTMLIQMGVFVVVTFTTPILSERFGQGLEELLRLLLIIHIVAVPSTFAWSHFLAGQSRLAAMCLLLAAWVVVLLLLAFGSGPWMPVITITVIGCCLGATFSGLRGFLAESVEAASPVALFALATAAGRIAAAAGPALFSLVTIGAGDQPALLVILLVFVCGGGIILMYIRREAAATAGA